MKISLPKLKATILYFGTYTDPKFLGKVKLMKLFYFLDFLHVKKFGAPVTYDSYINLEYGPIPSMIKNMVDTADDDIDNSLIADTIMIEKITGSDMHRIVPVRKFTENDEKHFSENELEILKKVCLRFGSKNTKEIVDASHNEAPWKETKFMDTIPYTLAVNDPDCMATKEEISLITTIFN